MALRIFTNLSSLNSQRALEVNRSLLGSSIEKIASGIRVSRSSDDGAAMSISESLRSDVQALKQGSRNLNDGIAMVNTADGALNEQASILIRLRELSSQAATGTIGDTERATLNLEFSALRAEFDRIATTTEFNGRALVDGTLSANSSTTTILQIGANSDDANRINLNQELNLTEVTSRTLNFKSSNITTETDALTAMDNLTDAIDELIAIRGRVGSVQNRLTRAFNNLQRSIEGLTQAVSTVREADLAEEFAELTKNQVLVQASAAMIGQANLIPQSVLTLLQ
ncbi:flagellin [Candidatus Nitromaritima sp. SCGC AAA799-A02]|nr:flagellin [Candidatus Nitromaritima sp. SCGC AAA799-A02]